MERRCEKGDLRIQPLIDLSLDETVQNEGYQNRRDDQRGGNKGSGCDQKTPAQRGRRACHHTPAVSL
ncbi:hypothetical protein DY468_03860 [Rhodopseudomonas sp. BR0M22]|nr:hypothetical protein [Rhodopseudomonas sp. BR0M22]